MTELKTKATGASVSKFLNSIEDEQRRKDCKAVAAMMKKATGASAKMWGPSIVGFGRFQYSRRTKETFEWFQCGVSPRTSALTLYLMGGYPKDAASVQKLGKFKTGGGCLYIKRLEDVHEPTLRTFIAQSVKRIKAKQIDYSK